ncbi:hypothetical protein GF312_22135 [Candidatus Poribacteria bacterium]|nr:hypothetical protein [Candidatus Poribacteria bacterium]
MYETDQAKNTGSEYNPVSTGEEIKNSWCVPNLTEHKFDEEENFAGGKVSLELRRFSKKILFQIILDRCDKIEKKFLWDLYWRILNMLTTLK